MGWGFMMGLGQGLTQAGGMIQDFNKQKLAAQLEKDKEDRADKRADLVYNRDQMSFDHEMWAPDPASIGDPGGEVMRIYKVNKAGDKYGEGRLPTQDELQERNRAQQAANISLQTAILGNKKIQMEVDNMPQEQADKHALTQSQAGYYNDRGDAAVTNASRPRSGGKALDGSDDASPEDIARQQVDDYKEYFADQLKTGAISLTDMRRESLDATRWAAIHGTNPNTEFLSRMNDLIKQRGIQNTPTSPDGTPNINWR